MFTPKQSSVLPIVFAVLATCGCVSPAERATNEKAAAERKEAARAAATREAERVVKLAFKLPDRLGPLQIGVSTRDELLNFLGEADHSIVMKRAAVPLRLDYYTWIVELTSEVEAPFRIRAIEIYFSGSRYLMTQVDRLGSLTVGRSSREEALALMGKPEQTANRRTGTSDRYEYKLKVESRVAAPATIVRIEWNRPFSESDGLAEGTLKRPGDVLNPSMSVSIKPTEAEVAQEAAERIRHEEIIRSIPPDDRARVIVYSKPGITWDSFASGWLGKTPSSTAPVFITLVSCGVNDMTVTLGLIENIKPGSIPLSLKEFLIRRRDFAVLSKGFCREYTFIESPTHTVCRLRFDGGRVLSERNCARALGS